MTATIIKDSVIQIRVKSTTKTKVDKILSQFGMSTSQAVNMFLSEVERTESVPLNLSLQPKGLSPELIEIIRKARLEKGVEIRGEENINNFIDSI